MSRIDCGRYVAIWCDGCNMLIDTAKKPVEPLQPGERDICAECQAPPPALTG